MILNEIFYGIRKMGELVPFEAPIIAGAAEFYQSNKSWIDPAIAYASDKISENMDEKTMEEFKRAVVKKAKSAWGRATWQNPSRNGKINSRKRKYPKKNRPMSNAPLASIPNTIKCMDLGKCHVRGRKSMRLDTNAGEWKTYKISYQDAYTPAAGQVGWYTTVSSFDNNNTSTKNTLNTGRYAGFNGVDKLCYIDGANPWNVLNVTAPTYSATANVRSIMTDAKNIGTTVVLRRQVVQMNWQNADTTKTAEVTVYLVESKKDLYEWQSKTANQKIAEDYLGYGFLQKYTTTGSVGLPTNGIAQPSLFTLNDNPRFEEFFKIINKTKTCLQPGQSCRKSYIMNGNQALSYKHLAKNIADWNDVGPVASYYHIGHKKGEKFFIFKVHGTMEPSVSAAKPGYTNANVVTWWESTWQATYVDLITQSEYLNRVSNF